MGYYHTSLFWVTMGYNWSLWVIMGYNRLLWVIMGYNIIGCNGL